MVFYSRGRGDTGSHCAGFGVIFDSILDSLFVLDFLNWVQLTDLEFVLFGVRFRE